MSRRIISVVPSDQPVGGIAKVLDYAVHAARCGFESIFSPLAKLNKNSVLYNKPYYQKYKNSIDIKCFSEIKPRKDDIVLFSLPSNLKNIQQKYNSPFIGGDRLIHLVQNTRHTNIYFDNGFSFRLLPKSMIRICITEQVLEEIEPYVEDNDNLSLIRHGFDFDFFDKAPTESDTVSVCFNNFKGDLGKQIVAAATKAGLKFNYFTITKGISWKNLREAYQKSTIFLGTPLEEEGLYLPGLEAMAAGCIVLTSDAYGNRFYTQFGSNAIQVGYRNISDYVYQLANVIDKWDTNSLSMRQKAHSTAKSLGLEDEFYNFYSLVRDKGLVSEDNHYPYYLPDYLFNDSMGDNSIKEKIINTVGAEFDPEYYLKKYPDVNESNLDPLYHFLHWGSSEGRNPNDWFSTKGYLQLHGDVKALFLSAFVHYVIEGRKEEREILDDSMVEDVDYLEKREIISEFDPEYYLSRYPDVANSQVDPLIHFLKWGAADGRDPCAWFSTKGYRRSYPFLIGHEINPFVHYLSKGRDEGRIAITVDEFNQNDKSIIEAKLIKPEFDAKFYVDNNIDVLDSGMDPLQHFIEYGAKELRDPCAWFSATEYVNRYKSVKKDGFNPFFHYISIGRDKGLEVFPSKVRRHKN